ncbi:MAG: Spx/MgsR family RNA polymerase-binding regulatory protein [Xanthomonadales bacterium]|jgi:Spx/MgsR family transcriptional regulator|nr:Spx/MgsR family RNA polymerase-binding regulatory protein [Xanthomonadales bacterium]
MSVTLYGLGHCGTCKKACAWLEGEGISYEFIDYRKNPIEPEKLTQWAAQLGWPKVVNRASMTWRKLDESQKDPQSDAEWLALIADNDALVRRPVIVTETGVQFGFSEKKIGDIL